MNLRTMPALVGVLIVSALGCDIKIPTPPVTTPVVPISQPIRRAVTDYLDYTGRTDSVNSVEIRPRVTGYLTKMPFTEGSEVKKGALLFEVDPRPYQAQLDQAEGQVELNKARLELAKADYARALEVAKTPGAISQQDVDTYKAKEAEAKAAVDAAEANCESYKLNREFCEVTSPIDGEVSRYYLTLGNLASQDTSLLTTVVSLDPIYAYFDVDERTLLNIRSAINSGKLQRAKPDEIPVMMGLQGEEGFPHEGVVNFINNQVDPYTGTITLRGKFANPKPATGVRLFSPGLFVRIRVPIGKPHEALLVTDRAVGTDQGLKYLYVVDKDNKVQYRRVKLGALQDDGLRVVSEGIEPDDWVVVSGLQMIRPGVVVESEKIPMPIPMNESSNLPDDGSEPVPPAKSEPAKSKPDAKESDSKSDRRPAGEKAAKANPADANPAVAKPAIEKPSDDKPATPTTLPVDAAKADKP